MLEKIAYALVLACWAWLFIAVWIGTDKHQFDFQTFYSAARCYELGRSPYDVENLHQVGNSHLLGFYYPLATLHLLRPLCRLDFDSARRIWLTLEAAALVALMLIWKRAFLPATGWLGILAVGLFGFHGAAVWDVKMGNISLFEQLFLWTGFAFLLRSRPTAFVCCVVLASISKLLPAAFLLLLFLPGLRSPANTARALLGFLAVAVVTLAPFAADPQYLPGFLAGLAGQHPRLEFNPSLVGVADELFYLTGAPLFIAPGFQLALLAVYVGLVLHATRRLLGWAFGEAPLRVAILVAALLYALLMPRMILYSYLLAVAPALALLVPLARRARFGEAVAVLALCLGGLELPPARFGKIVGDAAPWLLLLCGWFALARLKANNLNDLAQAIK